MKLSSSCSIGNIDPQDPIQIIGGGFSGLCLGYFLKKRQIPFKLYEKESRVGGKIDSHSSPYGNAETAAHAFFMNEPMLDEIKDLNLTPLYATKKLKKKVYRNNRFSSPILSAGELFGLGSKALFKKPPKYHPKMTLAEFLAPLGNDDIQKEVFAAAMLGVYAADSNELHLRSLFPAIDFSNIKSYLAFFIEMKKNKSPFKFRSISFSTGMRELTEAIRVYISDEIETSSYQKALSHNAIICTNAHEASDLLQADYPELSRRLSEINYQAVSSATLFTQYEIEALKKSFGCLFSPRAYSGKIRGLLANWEIFPDQRKSNTHHSYTFIMDGCENISEHLENELKALSLESAWKQKLYLSITPWEKGLPLYNFQRFRIIEEIRSSELKNIGLFGNYIGGISLREIFNAAKYLAEDIYHERS